MKSIEEIVEKIKNGENRKEELYEILKPFLDYQELKYSGSINGRDIQRGDIKSLVWLGIEKAIESFSPQKNFKFVTWASSCIKYVFKSEYKKAKTREYVLDITSDEGETLPLEEIAEDSSAKEAFDDAETRIDGKKAILELKKLSKTEQKIIILTCIKNISPAKVARDMGISSGRLRTIKLSALKKLKSAILQ